MSNKLSMEQLNRLLQPRYSLRRSIGQGSYGQVYEAVWTEKNEIVAIKVCRSQWLKESQKEQKKRAILLQNEVKAMQLCNSSYVVKIIDHIDLERHKAIVMEYCDGPTLKQHIQSRQRGLSQQEALAIIRQLARGLQELQKNNIIHRDLKPENIFSRAMCFKIGDLGFVRVLQKPDMLAKSALGTFLYAAPQILLQKEYGFLVDMWSLGVIFYNMLTKSYPFIYMGSFPKEMFQTIQQNIPVKFPNIVSRDIRDLIRRMLTVDPAQRIKWEQFYAHPLLQSSKIHGGRPIKVVSPDILPKSEVLRQSSHIDLVEELSRSNLAQQSVNAPHISELMRPMEFPPAERNEQYEAEVAKHHNILLEEKAKFKKYSREIELQIIKLNILLKYVIQIENVNLRKEFNKSRRITELRLLVAQRCMKKAEMLNRLFGPGSQNSEFKFSNDKNFRESEEWKSLQTNYKQSYDACQEEACKGEYEAVSKHLTTKESQFNNRFKDFFLRLSGSEVYEKKQRFLRGVEGTDFTMDKHTDFVMEYVKEILPRFEEIKPCRVVYYMLAVLKQYRTLAAYGGDLDLPTKIHEDLEHMKYLERVDWKQEIKKLELYL